MKINFVESRANFDDCYNNECSFQSDEIEGNKVLWLGVNRQADGNKGNRMVLDRGRAMVLLHILKQFVETGKVASNPDEMPTELKQVQVNDAA